MDADGLKVDAWIVLNDKRYQAGTIDRETWISNERKFYNWYNNTRTIELLKSENAQFEREMVEDND